MWRILELEEQGWQALSSEGDTSKEFYGAVLADDAVMIFQGGLLIEGKREILNSLSGQPWESFSMEEPRVISLSEGVAVVVYRVVARRKDSDAYQALVSSTYALRDDEWKLVVHQQTPV
jgi:hypothetical protein